MTDITGTCSSKVVTQTMIGVPGQDRQVGIAMIAGQHTSRGTPWDGAKLTYVGTSDIAGGSGGTQRGYFHNVHTDGAVSEGTFEAKATMPKGVPTVEGTWTLTGGSGSLAGVRGGGAFKAQMTSPTDSEMAWSGSFQL